MNKHFTNLHDLVTAFAGAMDLTVPDIQNHHQRVAYISYRLAEEMGLNEKECLNAMYGGLVHDIGSIAESGDVKLTDIERNLIKVASTGADILREFAPLKFLSEMIMNSQSRWDSIPGYKTIFRGPVLYGQIVKLADSVSLMLDGEGTILNRVARIQDQISCAPKGYFNPGVLEAFGRLCKRDHIWMDVYYRPSLFLDFIPTNRDLSLDEVLQFTQFVSHMIDFRSPFTAMHSAGVAATAERLARLCGMSEEECRMMRVAGYLHDLGKLKIPSSILEKPGKLTDDEFNVMKEHTYYTYVLLKDIEGFEQISKWAAYHHEKLNGKGYPFRLCAPEIPFGSRIMAVADIFSAVSEERPYRKGMSKDQVISVLESNVGAGAISGDISDLLIRNYDDISVLRDNEARAAGKRYFASIGKESSK